MMSKFNWKFPSYTEEEIKNLKNSLDVSDTICKILLSRGINDTSSIKEYLTGEYEEGYDPYLLYDMDKAVKRINYAIENEEKILIYGDYDADGITSTVLMLETLISLGADVSSYIPNRFNEGYGPNKTAFTNIINSGIKLIITVDNGIAAVEEIELANDMGCDVIITDHHKIQKTLPNAYAIIHPEHPKGDYPFSKLAGVGVAFKLSHALLEIYPDFLLDLVAIGTVADLVPMISENRIFVKQGLKLLNEDTRIGLKLLLDIANYNGKIDEQTIGFIIAPRLNAIGRIDSAKDGLLFLSTENSIEAQYLAEKISNYNIERKNITEYIINDIEEKIENYNDKSVIMIYSENYHEGVLGIVASSIVEKYKKPTFIMNLNEENLKGSARSYNNFNIYEAINNIGDLFSAYGGHTMAAGFSTNIENINDIENKICELYDNYLKENKDYKETKNIDLILKQEDISYQLFNDIELLKPYGAEFEKVIILINDANVLEKLEFGNNKQYLKLILGNDNEKIECISFKDNDNYKKINTGDTIDLICNLDKNSFNGRTKLQLQIIDIKHKNYLFSDQRKNNIDFNNIEITELKLSKNYSDEKNNFYTYNDLDNINKEYNIINILDIPNNMETLKKIISLHPKKINLFCRENKLAYLTYNINKEKLITLFNLILKFKKINLDDNTIIKITNTIKTNVDTLKIIIQIFLELKLVKIENNTLKLDENYSKINLEKSKTYNFIKNKIEVEKLLLEQDIKYINEKLNK